MRDNAKKAPVPRRGTASRTPRKKTVVLDNPFFQKAYDKLCRDIEIARRETPEQARARLESIRS